MYKFSQIFLTIMCMDFYELNAFYILSKTLHFAKTAEKVNLSPSALSRLIARLEEETNTILLERNNREVFLTEDGKYFSEFAKKCLDEKEDIISQMSAKNNKIKGILKVYASVTACYSIIPPFLKELSEQYPDIHLSLETGDPASAINAIKDGRADIAVTAIPKEGIKGLDCFPIRITPLVFAASVGGPYENVSGSPQDIVSSVPLILPKSGLARERFDLWVESRNVKPVIAAETEGNEAIMALVQLGIGIGLVPHIVLTTGPYTNGFTSHSAGNALGSYEIGFIKKQQPTGSDSHKRMLAAVNKILLK